MWNVLMPLMMAVLGYFRLRKDVVVSQVAKGIGLSEDTVGKVGTAVETLLAPSAQTSAAGDSEVELAREHDTQMNGKAPPVVELLRGLVRPLITLTAFAWYVYARANGVVLSDEDYAIVGGVVAFWFGFRPFEKHGALKAMATG